MMRAGTATRLCALLCAVFCTIVCTFAAAPLAAQERFIPLDQLKSGFDFLGSDVQQMQLDDFANPGMLWLDRGAQLWNKPAGPAAKSCATCHGDVRTSMKGVATRYPMIDKSSGELLNIEGRILQCRTRRQGAPAFAYESEDLLALTTLVAHQSRGMPIHVSIDGPARAHFEAGRAFYYQRHGQLNLACTHCHEQNWGKVLYNEPISQGQPNAYPIYRLYWQTLGSLERRFRSCLFAVRAEMLPYGSPEYRDLALFLAWRAQGLKIETPGIRR